MYRSSYIRTKKMTRFIDEYAKLCDKEAETIKRNDEIRKIVEQVLEKREK